MSFKEFTKELNGNRVEGELIKTIFYSILTSFFTLVVLYYLKLKNIEDFFPKYGLFLFLSVLSLALISATLRQVRAYKEFACMSGMMIGMTTGMIAGFLSGFYVGATNGMFIGGVFGLCVGIWLGVWMGKCCGIMGHMEGIMAGFMGGLMGAMTAVMLLNDNLRWAAIIIFIISSLILISLNYMIYKEMKENQRQKHEDHMITVIVTFVLIIITMWIMIFGPRSALFG
ncbi:hypothetical protein HYW75_05930 [Candidatus Pacearchaeota archaeon]|nr:hypothetical protein [Candidatus Pacearchaeota archaeon]